MRYPTGFDVRRLMISIHKSTEPHRLSQTNGKRSPSRQFENQLHNGKDDWTDERS